MSDLATAGHLRQATTQFPVSWYCDPRVLEAEQRAAARARPGYVGHELMVPEVGRLPRARRARRTRRCSSATRAASSSCRTSAGTGRRSCSTARGNARQHRVPDPSLDVRPAKASCSARRTFADKPCLNLGRTPLQNWNGLLFDGPRDVGRDLAGARRPAISTSRATCSTASRCIACNYNWKIVHRGLSRGLPRRPVPSGTRPVRHLRRPQVGVRRLVFGADRRHQQRAREARHADVRALAQGGARLLPRRDAAARRDVAHLLPERHARVVSARARRSARSFRKPSTARSTSSSSTIPRKSRCSSANSSRPSRRRIMETAKEDDEIAERMDAGRRALYRAGAAKSARTSRRWKTACSTSTSSTGARWKRTSAHR